MVSVASSKTQYRIRRKHSPCRYRLRIRQVVVNALRVDSDQGRSLEGEEVGLCRLGLTSYAGNPGNLGNFQDPRRSLKIS